MPDLGDFLDVPDRLEPQLNLAQGSHIPGICRCCTKRYRLSYSSSKGMSSKHGSWAAALLADSEKFGYYSHETTEFQFLSVRLVRVTLNPKSFFYITHKKKMADEPLFDPSLKKRKKKNVVFIEDPLGADADPTKPAPETIDSTTINGEAVDLGPSTAHELMKGSSRDLTSSNKEKEEEDFKAMFGDMKKKKKKKEIPMDFVRFYWDSFIEPNNSSYFLYNTPRETTLALLHLPSNLQLKALRLQLQKDLQQPMILISRT